MILIPIFSHKRGQIERNHIKPTIHPPSWWSAWTFSTFKGICTKYTENRGNRDWHWRKQTLFYLWLYFPCRFETKYESNIHRYQDTYLRAFTIVAILVRRLLSTYTTVILYYRSSSIVDNASMFVGVIPLLELKILEIHSTTDQVWVSSFCVNFCRSNALFGTSNTGNTQFSAVFSYMLWYIDLKVCTWLLLDSRLNSSVVIFRQFFKSYAPFRT